MQQMTYDRALDITIPNYASAIVTTAEVFDSISKLSLSPVQPEATYASSRLTNVSGDITATIAFPRFYHSTSTSTLNTINLCQ